MVDLRRDIERLLNLGTAMNLVLEIADMAINLKSRRGKLAGQISPCSV